MTFCVRRRTSSTGSFSIAVTSNHSCSASLVVPAPTNCRPAFPDAWSPPSGCLISLAKVTLSDSGFNCTSTCWPPSFSALNSWFSSISLALASSPMRRVLPSALRRLIAKRLVRHLHLLDGDLPFLCVQRRRLDLDGHAARHHEAGALG